MIRKCVSVIIPVYNQEKVIERCINSVLNQTYKELQVIVINDGSTDNTEKLLMPYLNRDPRLEIYHADNKGVSAARNYGLSLVKGEYIQFVDGDDYVSETLVEDMVTALETVHADMGVCNYYKLMGKWTVPNRALDRPGVYPAKDYLVRTIKDPGHHYYGVTWNKIYRTQIIRNYKIQFDVGVTLGEDFIFNLDYWSKCSIVRVISEKNYYYNRTNQTSLSFCRSPELQDCLKEYDNRKKIFAHYIEIMRQIDQLETSYQDIYFYWFVFYIRQVDAFKNKYTSWSAQNIEQWHNILNNDAYVQEALHVVKQSKRKAYTIRYIIGQRIKNCVKKFMS